MAAPASVPEWLRPDGRSIHRWPDSKPADPWGVQPDPGLAVELTPADRLAYVEHLRSLDVVPGKPGTGPAAAAKKADGYTDKVLAKAVEKLAGKR